MAHPSAPATVTTTTASRPRKSRSQSQSSKGGTPKPLSQDELKNWWPFTRVDGKVLESLHRKHLKANPPPSIFDTAEEAFL